MADDIYPRVPRPRIDDRSVADEIKVDGTEERYLIVPRPWSELVRDADEIYLRVPRPWSELIRDADEIYLRVPRPCNELVSCGVEIILDKFVIADDR